MRTPIFSRRSVIALCGALLFSGAACFTIDDPVQNLALFSIVDGNNQTVQAGATSDPLVVQTLDGQIAPMAGNNISWVISSGSGTLSSTATVTGEDGTSQVTFTANSTPGPVAVRASTKDISVTFAITVVAAR